MSELGQHGEVPADVVVLSDRASELLAEAVSALYLPGVCRPVSPAPRRWPVVVSVLRRCAGVIGKACTSEARVRFWEQASDACSRLGLIEEAMVLRWAEARNVTRAARTGVVQVMDAAYPAGWRDRLGCEAPPAVWIRGACSRVPEHSGQGKWLGIVGTRAPSREHVRAVEDLVIAAAESGLGVITGGATGVDRLAARAARQHGIPVCEVLPCGLEVAKRQGFGLAPTAGPAGRLVQYGIAAPREAFSRVLAMRRNALIYAGAVGTVVLGARFREGGSWHGAIEALRRRLGPVFVLEYELADSVGPSGAGSRSEATGACSHSTNSASRAAQALVGLGAHPLDPKRLDLILAQATAAPYGQPSLFGGEPVGGVMGLG